MTRSSSRPLQLESAEGQPGACYIRSTEHSPGITCWKRNRQQAGPVSGTAFCHLIDDNGISKTRDPGADVIHWMTPAVRRTMPPTASIGTGQLPEVGSRQLTCPYMSSGAAGSSPTARRARSRRGSRSRRWRRRSWRRRWRRCQPWLPGLRHRSSSQDRTATRSRRQLASAQPSEKSARVLLHHKRSSLKTF